MFRFVVSSIWQRLKPQFKFLQVFLQIRCKSKVENARNLVPIVLDAPLQKAFRQMRYNFFLISFYFRVDVFQKYRQVYCPCLLLPFLCAINKALAIRKGLAQEVLPLNNIWIRGRCKSSRWISTNSTFTFSAVFTSDHPCINGIQCKKLWKSSVSSNTSPPRSYLSCWYVLESWRRSAKCRLVWMEGRSWARDLLTENGDGRRHWQDLHRAIIIIIITKPKPAYVSRKVLTD